MFEIIKIRNPRIFARIMKEIFISRFATVSATKLKSYLLGRIFNSYIDFINVHRYFKEVMLDSPKYERSIRNAEIHRNDRYFETKGKNYWIHLHRDPIIEQHHDLTQPLIISEPEPEIHEPEIDPPTDFEPDYDSEIDNNYDFSQWNHLFSEQAIAPSQGLTDLDIEFRNEFFSAHYEMDPTDRQYLISEGIDPDREIYDYVTYTRTTIPNYQELERNNLDLTERDHPDI